MKFFTVPASEAGDAEQEVNAFLSGHRVLTVDRQLVRDDTGSYWALCVSYLESGKPPKAKGQLAKVDYKEVLPPAEFEAFAHLRRVRKELAERDDVVVWGRTRGELRVVFDAAQRYAEELLRLEIKPGWQPQRTERGVTLCGFRVRPGRLGLSQRRRRRYRQARKRWEDHYAAGRIDTAGPQADYASALAITAGSHTAAWRRRELDRRPPVAARAAANVRRCSLFPHP